MASRDYSSSSFISSSKTWSAKPSGKLLGEDIVLLFKLFYKVIKKYQTCV